MTDEVAYGATGGASVVDSHKRLPEFSHTNLFENGHQSPPIATNPFGLDPNDLIETAPPDDDAGEARL